MREPVSAPYHPLAWLVFFGVAALGLASLIQSFVTAPYLTDGRVVFEEARSYWRNDIERLGNKEAHAKMLDVAEKLPLIEAHSLAHSFGEALFESAGLEGAGTCGDEFLWGCYHQYVGNVLVSYGADVVPELYETCKEIHPADSFGCEHGIGHGLLGFYGYDSDGLSAALRICDSLEIPFRWNGCYDGVFMEFNLRELTTTDNELSNPRPFVVEKRYEPCLSLDARYREMCVRELPIWWASQGDVVFDTTDSRFASLGSWCLGLSDEKLLPFCFRGIGHMAVQGTDPSRFAKLCDEATENESYNLHCRTLAAKRMHTLHPDKETRDMCTDLGLDGTHLEYCVANLEADRSDAFMDAVQQEPYLRGRLE